jgi:glycosyltransferase involved in cell wall biosynthesis
MEAQINVCFIINNLGQGGAERQFVELIKNIDKQRFNVTLCLYAVNKGVFFKDVFSIPKVRVVQNILKKRNRILKIIEALIFIRKLLKRNSYDIVHATLFMNCLFVRLIAPRKYNDRIVANIRTSLSLYKRTWLLFEKLLIRRSYVVTNTKRAADEFIGKLTAAKRGRVTYIYNGYDTDLFRPRKIIKSADEIIIGCIGRVYYIKNQIQVVRVVHALNNDSVKLRIVGESGDQEELINTYVLENGLEKHITLSPKQSHIEDLYNEFDIIVVSSLLEGCPNVLFEAMLCECLCIISINANTDRFVTHGVNGLVYDGTDNDLKEKMEYAISILGTSTLDRIKKNGYQYASDDFSIEKMVRSYEILYNNIVN